MAIPICHKNGTITWVLCVSETLYTKATMAVYKSIISQSMVNIVLRLILTTLSAAVISDKNNVCATSSFCSMNNYVINSEKLVSCNCSETSARTTSVSGNPTASTKADRSWQFL